MLGVFLFLGSLCLQVMIRKVAIAKMGRIIHEGNSAIFVSELASMVK